MVFIRFIPESLLKEAQRFTDDVIITQYLQEIQHLAAREEKVSQLIAKGESGEHAIHQIYCDQSDLRSRFLERLSLVKDRERAEEFERKNQARDERLLDLQSEVADLAKRGHSLTQRATLFAGLAGVLSLFGVCFTGLQFFESQKANQLIEVQNSYLQQQNRIAADALEFSKSKPPSPSKKEGK